MTDSKDLVERVRALHFWFFYRLLGGHVSIGALTIYGNNAMHWAWNLRTKRWGYVCFRPTTPYFKWRRDRNGYLGWWRWYFYVSPDATPQRATWAIGPGVERRQALADETEGET